MSVISDIIPQKNDKKRVNLYIDGSFFSGVEKIVLLSENLHINDYVDKARLEKIVEESEYTSCFQKAANYLLKGSRTKKQVAGYLKQKGYSGKIIYKVIEKLCEYDYIDDKQFAEDYVEAKSHKYGKRYIYCRLKEKGIEEDIALNALNSVKDESAAALSVAVKYAAKKPKDFKTKQQCFRYVISKGFSYEAAKEAVDNVFSDAIWD